MVRKLKRSMPKGIHARDYLNDGRNPAPMGQREEIRLTIFVCHSAGAKLEPHFLAGPRPGTCRSVHHQPRGRESNKHAFLPRASPGLTRIESKMVSLQCFRDRDK